MAWIHATNHVEEIAANHLTILNKQSDLLPQIVRMVVYTFLQPILLVTIKFSLVTPKIKLQYSRMDREHQARQMVGT